MVSPPSAAQVNGRVPTQPHHPCHDPFRELRQMLATEGFPATSGTIARPQHLYAPSSRHVPSLFVPSRPSAAADALHRRPGHAPVNLMGASLAHPPQPSLPATRTAVPTITHAPSHPWATYNPAQYPPREPAWPAAHATALPQPHGVVRAAPAPLPDERQAKRGKPSARRSLQALFDAAADESTLSLGTTPDVDDDADTASGSATSSQTLCSTPQSGSVHGGSCFSPVSPVTPVNLDSSAAAAQLSSAHALVPPTPSTLRAMPLQQLLQSERGRRLTALDAKAIVLRITADLCGMHASNAVHRRVSLAAITLACAPGGIAAATLGPAPAGVSQETGLDSHLPPEVAFCPADRARHTPAGDIWALGVALFSLLSGGGLPFGAGGLCGRREPGFPAPGHTVDALQRWIHAQLCSAMDAVNQLQQAPSARDGSKGAAGMVGFDPEAKHLLLGMCRADPAQRLTAERVLAHPWLAHVEALLPPNAAELRRQAEQCMASPQPIVPASWMDTATEGTCALAPAISTGSLGDMLQRTARLASSLAPSNELSSPTPNGASGSVSAYGNLAGGPSPGVPRSQGHAASLGLAASATWGTDTSSTCAYPVIGHVSQPVEVTQAGRRVMMSALHAVYDVPGHGAMMSAQPVAVTQPSQMQGLARARMVTPRPGAASLGEQQPRADAQPFMPLLARLMHRPGAV